MNKNTPKMAKHPLPNLSWFGLFIAISLQILITNAADCNLPRDWFGDWFHSGFPSPVRVDAKGISVKGECVQRDSPNGNMFLIRNSEARFGACYQCMMIYEKHNNVLQYKESYCEENVESMESLCNTIAGDAPLYTMFRKDGNLIKCPLRGPHSFSYTKGARGQICEYPSSYMDTCSDHKRMKLKYQACLDVEGSEIATEEYSCLAKWKEGSSWYLVALMNGTHIRTDEARYKCFLYQKQRNSKDQSVVYKMSQSDKASCVGLWSVDEGVKTFTMNKLETSGAPCHFPTWLGRHHDWTTIDPPFGQAKLHLNRKGHSFKLSNVTSGGQSVIESHVTCHSVQHITEGSVAKVVAHVKTGCDSGYVCMIFHSRDQHVIQMRYGGQSRHPSEACMNFYFDPKTSPVATLVAGGHQNTRPCPFSGRYSLVGQKQDLLDLIQIDDRLDQDEQMFGDCSELNVVMHAGCSDSADLQVEAHCQKRSISSQKSVWSGHDGVMNDAPNDFNGVLRSEFTCHGKWEEEIRMGKIRNDMENVIVKRSVSASLSPLSTSPSPSDSSSSQRHFLMLSTGPTLRQRDNSISSRRYVCLTYVEQDGVLLASTSSCSSSSESPLLGKRHFNITSSGPCLQALTGEAFSTAIHDSQMTRRHLLLQLLCLLTIFTMARQR